MGACSNGCALVMFISKIKPKPALKSNWRSTTVGVKPGPVEVPNKQRGSK